MVLLKIQKKVIQLVYYLIIIYNKLVKINFMKNIALFPGSFDPYTSGHHDIVQKSLKLFDKIVICIGHNSNKKRYFDENKILRKIKILYQKNKNIDVIIYNELTAKLAKKYNADFILRGLRNTTDFEFENSISQLNKHLNKELETVFFITSPKHAHISSTIIREVHEYGGNINKFLPYKLK